MAADCKSLLRALIECELIRSADRQGWGRMSAPGCDLKPMVRADLTNEGEPVKLYG
jgi:hypothetical protein